MLLREDAHLAHVDRSLAIEEALLVMAQGGLPQHLVLSAWRDAAVAVGSPQGVSFFSGGRRL